MKYAANPSASSIDAPDVNCASWLARRPEWAEREYREAYAQEAISQGVAWQIKINRTKRKMSQAALARALGTKQSAISRLEDPNYGAQNLETLGKVARVFDCALLVQLVPYSRLAQESERLSAEEQFAAPYDMEIKGNHGGKSS